MPVFTFPRKIYFQRDIIDDLPGIIAEENIKRALIVTDKIIYSIFSKKIENFKKSLEISVFSDVNPEPKIDEVEEAYKKLMNFDPDAIIAMGGGSVIDFAKALAVKFSYPEKDLSLLNPFERIDLKTKIIAIPTTSGTGSDVSFGVVLTQSSRKIALGNYDLVPYIDVLDSSLTPSKKEIIRSTGVDALVHAFEAICANTSNILTDALAEKAIITIFDNLPGAINNKEDAKENMHIAATMAGMAFSNSGTALAHALGHSLGAVFHITHGTSVGIFLPLTIEFNSKDDKTREKYNKISRMLGLNSFNDLIIYIEKFYREIGQPIHVKDLGIKKDEYMERLDMLVNNALQDSELAFNPVVVGEEDLRFLFTKAYSD